MTTINHTFTEDGITYYYIHRHIKNFESASAMSLFQEQKRNNYQIMKNRFRKNYFESLNGTTRASLETLDSAMNEDEILNNLDADVLNTLENSVTTAIANYNFDTKIKSAYNSLNNFLNGRDAKALEKMLEQIASATKLLTTNKAELTFLLGIKQQYAKNQDLTKLYQYIAQGIKTLEGKVINVNAERIQSINNSLLNLIGDLAKGKFTRQALNGYLRNIFSTQIGEYIISKGLGQGLDVASKTIHNSLAGTKNVELKNDPDLEAFIQQYGQQGNQVFKTDNSFQNLHINIKDGEQIDINLGLSTKWYKGSGNTIYDVTIATEASFMNRVQQMFQTPIELYYAYNTLALAGQSHSLYAALKAALIARNLDVLISGLGVQGDFSQYLVINGNFYSIWQIINVVEYFNQGQGSYEKGNGTDPITISATGLSKVINYTEEAQAYPNNLMKAYARSKEQNKLINDLGLSAHFYPNRLKNALASMK